MSMNRYEIVGWYLVCHRKRIGFEHGRATCPSNGGHIFNTYHDTKFCPTCGAPVMHEQEERYASFFDVFESEEFVGSYEFCRQLAQEYYHVPLEIRPEHVDVLEPMFDGLFALKDYGDDKEEFMADIDINTIAFDFDRQRELIREKIKDLAPLYDNIEIHFGRIVYWA